MAFQKLGGLRALTTAPFMALTATASPETELFITESLHLNQPVSISLPLNRPNIFFSASQIKGLTVSFNVCSCLNCDDVSIVERPW